MSLLCEATTPDRMLWVNVHQDHVVAFLDKTFYDILSLLDGFQPAANATARHLLSGADLSKILNRHSHFLVIEG